MAMLPGMAIVAFGQNAGGSPRWLTAGIVTSIGPSFSFGEVLFDEIRGCDTLRSGTGLVWWRGLTLGYPTGLGPVVELRGSLTHSSGELRGRSRPGPIAGGGGEVVDARVDDVLEYRYTSLSLAGMVAYPVLDDLSLSAGVTYERDLSVDQEFRQEAIFPESLLLGNRQRSQTLRTGVITSSSPAVFGLLGGIRYELPVSSRSSLAPELLVSFPLSSRSREGAWRDFSVMAGLALRIGVLRLDAPPVPPPPQQADTPVVIELPPALEPSVTTHPEVVRVHVTELDSVEALPLLDQVFFAEGSSEIPARYRTLAAEQTGTFAIGDLKGTQIEVYHDLLNIVGLRMRGRPDAKLRINGYRNGRERDSRLARKRAEAVRRYLLDAWSIAPARISVAGGGLPPDPARETTHEGLEENARVELAPSDPNITGPVLRRHIQRVATPPSITFFPETIAEAGVAAWRLAIQTVDSTWRTFEGNGPLPDSIRWDWRSDGSDLPTIPMRLSYRIEVTDSTGNTAATPDSPIEVQYEELASRLERRVSDSTIESYSLLLFNFDSPKVSEDDQALLRSIAGRVDSGAVARFSGFTDSLGLEQHNIELALARARETARLFRTLGRPGVILVVGDTGGIRKNLPYELPEGRSYARTVVIDVRTPAKKRGM